MTKIDNYVTSMNANLRLSSQHEKYDYSVYIKTHRYKFETTFPKHFRVCKSFNIK